MKKISVYVALLALFIGMSCTEPEGAVEAGVNQNQGINKESVESFKGDLIKHRGLEVVNRFKIPDDRIDDFIAIDVVTDEMLQNQDRVMLVLNQVIKDFPYNEEGEVTQAGLNMIRRDFPRLKSVDLLKNAETIENYYAKNLERKFALRYRQLYMNGGGLEDGGLKVVDDNDLIVRRSTSASSSEYTKVKCLISQARSQGYSFNKFLAYISLYRASKKATAIAPTKFPNMDRDDTQRDAYRHLLWVSFLGKYYYTISSKVKKMQFAKGISDANEVCNANNNEVSKQMDLHNNAASLYYFNKHVKYQTFLGMTYGVSVPSSVYFVNGLKSVADRANYINKGLLGIPTTLAKIRAEKEWVAVYVKRKPVNHGITITFRHNSLEYKMTEKRTDSQRRVVEFYLESKDDLGLKVGQQLKTGYSLECYASDQGNCGGPCGPDIVGTIEFNGYGRITQDLGNNKFVLTTDDLSKWKVGGDNDRCDFQEVNFSAVFNR